MPIAIVSVYDKTNIEYVGRVLNSYGFDVFATPGTFRCLKDKQVRVLPIEEYCMNPPGFDGFFSSLSFNTLVGVLSSDNRMVADNLVESIGVVVYNFVPVWEIVDDLRGFTISNVDLGGPTIVRAAAINFLNTLPLVSPAQYPILENLDSIDYETRAKLAKEAFDYCSWYDRRLSRFIDQCLSV